MKKHTIQSLIFLVLLLVITPVLHAVSASPDPVDFVQPNGKTVTIMIRGNERIHWHESMDRYTLLFNQAGYLTYAQLDEDGNLQPSEHIAANIEQRDIVIRSFLNTIKPKLFYSEEQKRIMLQIWQIEDEVATRRESKNAPIVGTYKTLCAFVQFPEKPMTRTIAQFEGLMNQLGYTANGTGSVRDYYREVSYGQFDLIITLCGIYTAPQSQSYYAGNSGVQRCPTLARWLAQQVAADPNINFSDYDSNNDGFVDGFHFIFAGEGKETSGASGVIWSHKFQLSAPVTKNGKSIRIYSCSPELRSQTMITTIGVICHEMMHAFGAYDFYDTDYESQGSYLGTGQWDLMGEGAWNSNGSRPAHPNIYTKIQLGWVNPIVLNAPVTITNMPNSAENPVAYRINTTTNNEYFLLENRQKVKFDTSIPGNGLLIHRVHPNVVFGGNSNTINVTHPQLMYPVFAGSTVAIPNSNPSSYGNINSANCPFPGSSNQTSFTDATTPSMKSWAGNNTNKPITDIRHVGRLISFDFMGGKPSGSHIENDESNKIHVYSYLNSVYIKNKTSAVLKSVEIFDMTGRLIYQGTLDNVEKTEITLHVATGIYTVKLVSQNSNVTSKVLITKN